MSDLHACIRYLRRHGQAIGEAGRAGSARANRIMDLYRHAITSNDPAAVGALSGAIDMHRRSRATPPFAMPEDDCDHERGPNAGQCPDCGMTFVYCHACSEAGGAEMPIYHAAPVCASGGAL